MSSLLNPRLGFIARETARQSLAGETDDKLNGKIKRSGVEAARRKFTPEFINRLDKIVTFKPLGSEELRKILDIELNLVQQRIFNTAAEKSFVFKATDAAKGHFLCQGTDLQYGARHLKRAIERLLVQPMSNLIATDQVRGGDWIKVDFDESRRVMSLIKEAEGLPAQQLYAMEELRAELSSAFIAGELGIPPTSRRRHRIWPLRRTSARFKGGGRCAARRRCGTEYIGQAAMAAMDQNPSVVRNRAMRHGNGGIQSLTGNLYSVTCGEH